MGHQSIQPHCTCGGTARRQRDSSFFPKTSLSKPTLLSRSKTLSLSSKGCKHSVPIPEKKPETNPGTHPKMSYSSTRPDTTGYWKCCNCDDGTYNNPALVTKCLTCEHVKCASCETYSPPATTAEVGQYSIAEVDFSSSSPGGVQYAYPPQPLYASPVQPLAFSKTSMKGWWKCCQCEREVNPKLYGNTCPECCYDKCDYCTTY